MKVSQYLRLSLVFSFCLPKVLRLSSAARQRLRRILWFPSGRLSPHSVHRHGRLSETLELFRHTRLIRTQTQYNPTASARDSSTHFHSSFQIHWSNDCYMPLHHIAASYSSAKTLLAGAVTRSGTELNFHHANDSPTFLKPPLSTDLELR